MRVTHAGVLGAVFCCAFAAIGLAPHGAPSTAPTSAAPHAAPSIDVQLTGCAVVETDQTCELPKDRTLTVWLASPDASAITFVADRDELGVAPVPVEGGLRYRLVVPAGARTLAVRAATGVPVHAVSLVEPVTLPVVEHARALRRAGARREAESLLLDGLGALDVREHALAVGLLARLALERGAFEEAAAGLHRAIDECRQAGLASQAAYDANALAFVLTLRLERFDEALSVLEAAERDGVGADDAAIGIEHSRAQLDVQLGNYRAALAHARTADVRARRLGLDRISALARTSLAGALEALGRSSEAMEILYALDRDASPGLSGCDRANTLVSIGWALFLAHEVAASAPGAAAPSEKAAEPLQRALASLPGSCSDPFIRANALTNLALVEVQDGEAEAARAHLAEARGSLRERSALLELWWLDLDAAIAAREGRNARALELLADERRRAEAVLSPEVAWRATVGIAEVLDASGKTLPALDEYAHAEALLDEGCLDVPLGEGRETFLGDRERSARGRVGLLLRLGRTADALAAARTARTRAIRALERATRLETMDAAEQARWSFAAGDYRRRRRELAAAASEDWSRPADELARVIAARKAEETKLRSAIEEVLSAKASRRNADAPPALPDVSLLYRPLADGWVGFVVADGRVRASKLGAPPPVPSVASLSDWLLRPFYSELRAASRVRILASSALRNVDFHALVLDGEPLIARAAVEYSLDVGSETGEPPRPVESLVVSDPARDLAAARAEGDAIAAALAPRGRVELLSGPAASHASVLERLAAADVFHYGGHGVYRGRDGWDSALALASGGLLEVSDVLVLPRAPALATLSSCFAARSSEEAAAEGLGIANAFVLAGSRAVVAPARVVDDALAADVSRRFYAHLTHFDDEGIREAFRAALNDVREVHPGTDWAAYRLVVP